MPFEISGVAAHGSTPWPGLPHGIVVAGLPGTYSFWKTPSCAERPACQALPIYATPTYALSHEVLEAATNPYGRGWYAAAPLAWTARYVLSHGPPTLLGYDPPPPYPGEVADLCGPGSRASRRQMLSGALEPRSPLRVASFYRPGQGCVT